MVKWLLFFSLTATASLASAQQVHEFSLDNGLKLIVKEDHRSPIVVSQVWYKVGSSYEHMGITGVSHVLEHMMFKGTKKYGPNEFSRIIAENGGRENAFTGSDYTAYFQTMEKSRLAVSFELEADRMRNLLLKQEEFEKEVKVVMEERRMRTEDKPDSLTYERFKSVAMVTSPYRNPVIGWMNDLENMQLQDLADWYRAWYAPNNATLVVVGDVDANEVHKLARKYFGAIKPVKLTLPRPFVDVEHTGIKRMTMKLPAKLPSLYMGYRVPVVKDAKVEWFPYALEVLAGVLDGGDSARFTRYLVRDNHVAAGVGVSYDPFSRLPDLLTISGTPAEGTTVEQLEKAIRAQLEKVKNEPVDQKELDRIKAQVVAGKVYERDSVFYQAMQIGMLETVGLDWRLNDQYLEKIKAVTPEQVQVVARRFLEDDLLTVAVLEPLPIEEKH